MMVRLTVTVSSANKAFLRRRAKKANKSMSAYVNDLLASLRHRFERQKRLPEEGDFLDELFRQIKKQA